MACEFARHGFAFATEEIGGVLLCCKKVPVYVEADGTLKAEVAWQRGFCIEGVPTVAVAVVHAAVEVFAGEVAVAYDVFNDDGDTTGTQDVAAPHGDVGTLVCAVYVHVIEPAGTMAAVLTVKGTEVAYGMVVTSYVFCEGPCGVGKEQRRKDIVESFAIGEETV